MDINRRDFLKLVGLGSAVFVLGSDIYFRSRGKRFLFRTVIRYALGV